MCIYTRRVDKGDWLLTKRSRKYLIAIIACILLFFFEAPKQGLLKHYFIHLFYISVLASASLYIFPYFCRYGCLSFVVFYFLYIYIYPPPSFLFPLSLFLFEIWLLYFHTIGESSIQLKLLHTRVLSPPPSLSLSLSKKQNKNKTKQENKTKNNKQNTQKGISLFLPLYFLFISSYSSHPLCCLSSPPLFPLSPSFCSSFSSYNYLFPC